MSSALICLKSVTWLHTRSGGAFNNELNSISVDSAPDDCSRAKATPRGPINRVDAATDGFLRRKSSTLRGRSRGSQLPLPG